MMSHSKPMSYGPQIINGSPLVSGEVGFVYAVPINVIRGSAPYTVALVSGSLPAGLSLSGNVISGTPSGTAVASFSLQATDSKGANSTVTAFGLTVVAAVTITTTSLPNATAGVAYSTTLAAAGGVTPYVWAMVAGSMDPGLSLNPSTGVISGTPVTATTYSPTFQVTDALGYEAQQTLSLTVNSSYVSPTITTTSIPNGTVGVPYSFTMTGANGTLPYTWSINSGLLPNGLTLNASTGVISGTPTVAVFADPSITLTDAVGGHFSENFPITISAAGTLVVLTGVLNATQGFPLVQALQVALGTAPYTWSLVSQTGGNNATLSSTGILTIGSPVASGTITVSATDSASNTTGNVSLSLTVVPVSGALTINSPTTLKTATTGGAYFCELAVSGGRPPYSGYVGTFSQTAAGYTGASGTVWLMQSANDSLMLQAAVAATGSSDTVPFTVVDSLGATATRTFTIPINSTFAIQGIEQTTGVGYLPAAQVGNAYGSGAFGPFHRVAGTFTAPVTFSCASPPPGLTLSSAGVWNGTPTTAGTYSTIPITATDSSSTPKIATATFEMTVGADLNVSLAPWNIGYGVNNFFFQQSGQFYDSSGAPFRIRGADQNHYDNTGNTAAFNAAGCNSVRYWLYPQGGNESTQLSDFVASHINNNRFGIVTRGSTASGTLTSGSTSLAVLGNCVDQWVTNFSIWRPYQHLIGINIANEWGPANSPIWRDAYLCVTAPITALTATTLTFSGTSPFNSTNIGLGYVYIYGTGSLTPQICPVTATSGQTITGTFPTGSITGYTVIGGAIGILRYAGWSSPLFIDSGGSGQDIYNFLNYGAVVANSDPITNVVLDYHLYGYSTNIACPITALTTGGSTGVSYTGPAWTSGGYANNPFDTFEYNGDFQGSAVIYGAGGITAGNGTVGNLSGQGGTQPSWNATVGVASSGTYTSGGFVLDSYHYMLTIANLAALQSQGVCVSVLEFGPSTPPLYVRAGSNTLVTTGQVIRACEANGLGWAVWAMDDGESGIAINNFYTLCEYVGTYTGSPSQLSYNGLETVLDPLWGFGALASPASDLLPESQVATPTFSPIQGSYSSAQSVTISCSTAGSTIHYTTDGTTPTTASPSTPNPVTISTSKTVQAIAVASGLTQSNVGSAVYTITAAPVIKFNPGHYMANASGQQSYGSINQSEMYMLRPGAYGNNVNGYVLFVSWAYLDIGTSGPNYNFLPIDNCYSYLQSVAPGKRLIIGFKNSTFVGNPSRCNPLGGADPYNTSNAASGQIPSWLIHAGASLSVTDSLTGTIYSTSNFPTSPNPKQRGWWVWSYNANSGGVTQGYDFIMGAHQYHPVPAAANRKFLRALANHMLPSGNTVNNDPLIEGVIDIDELTFGFGVGGSYLPSNFPATDTTYQINGSPAPYNDINGNAVTAGLVSYTCAQCYRFIADSKTGAVTSYPNTSIGCCDGFGLTGTDGPCSSTTHTNFMKEINSKRVLLLGSDTFNNSFGLSPNTTGPYSAATAWTDSIAPNGHASYWLKLYVGCAWTPMSGNPFTLTQSNPPSYGVPATGGECFFNAYPGMVMNNVENLDYNQNPSHGVSAYTPAMVNGIWNSAQYYQPPWSLWSTTSKNNFTIGSGGFWAQTVYPTIQTFGAYPFTTYPY